MIENFYSLKMIYFFLVYVFARAFYFRRKNGAPIAARNSLFALSILIGFILKTIFALPIWFVIIPCIIMLSYAIKGIYDINKGKINPDFNNLKYDKFFIETLIVFILFFIITKLIGLDFILKGL